MIQETVVTIDESVSSSKTNLNRFDIDTNDEAKKEKILRRNVIKKKFIEWSTLATYHGYSKMFRTDLFILKLFWAVSLTFSLAMCTVLVARNITDYLKFETTSKIQLIHESPMNFPVIRFES
jgi:hypothetical protein